MADPVASLLQTLGGTKTTTNAGDTAALQSTLAQLQGQDFNALLQSIFQAAGGQIPGLQAAYGNAVGARRGGNSAIQAALNALLSQTSIAGADTVAKAQAQNLQTQANVGSNIATTTRGTTQQQGINPGTAAKNLAILQGLAKLAGTDIGKKLIDSSKGAVSGTGDQPAMSMAPNALSGPPPAMASSAAGAAAYAAPTLDLASVLSGESAVLPMDTQTEGDYGMSMAPADMFADFDLNSLIGSGGTPEMSMAPDEWFPEFDINSLLQ